MSDPEERGFTIVDKRGSDGDEEAPPEPAQHDAGEAHAAELPKADFTSLLLSLGTSALYHLGQAPDPEGGEAPEPNLPVARQTIDTLEVLEEKTHGNLSDEEAKLLTGLLTELRMRYVEASRGT